MRPPRAPRRPFGVLVETTELTGRDTDVERLSRIRDIQFGKFLLGRDLPRGFAREPSVDEAGTDRALELRTHLFCRMDDPFLSGRFVPEEA